jgi:hypothetical protein
VPNVRLVRALQAPQVLKALQAPSIQLTG